ncbi:MAG: peptide deformylase [Candidatus Firestonebacteria bacterium]|nr:peptide deformylase [Candidatus Firestonebacteria bacterium]
MQILKYGNSILRKKAQRIEKIDERIKKIAEAMISSLRAAKGIGLAANQVGIAERLCVVDTRRGETKGEIICLVNPKIVSFEGKVSFEEGCLSFPEIYAEIERPAQVKVSYKDLKGEARDLVAEGILARVLQHEIDHLNGVLFIDRMSKIKYLLLSKRLKVLQKENR